MTHTSAKALKIIWKTLKEKNEKTGFGLICETSQRRRNVGKKRQRRKEKGGLIVKRP